MANQQQDSRNCQSKNKVCSTQSDPLDFLSRVQRRKRSLPQDSGIKFKVSDNNNHSVQSSKNQLFYGKEEIVAAKTLVMMLSGEKSHKKKKLKIEDGKNHSIGDFNCCLPSMDERNAWNPMFSSRDTKTEENPRNNSGDWEIKKVLFKSDVGSLSRLMLSKKLVEEKILKSMKPAMAKNCKSPEGQKFRVYDVDKDVTHILTLKKLKSSNSFVFNGDWKSGFVEKRKLKENDEIGMSWDDQNCRFLFKLLYRAPDPKVNRDKP